jgi:hypothetical protein
MVFNTAKLFTARRPGSHILPHSPTKSIQSPQIIRDTGILCGKFLKTCVNCNPICTLTIEHVSCNPLSAAKAIF